MISTRSAPEILLFSSAAQSTTPLRPRSPPPLRVPLCPAANPRVEHGSPSQKGH